jgi:hypothetical protein
MQTPALHVDPVGQGSHPPQWVASPPLGGIQAPSAHCISPVGQLPWQMPLLHTSAPVQTVVQEPQCDAFEATQAPPHDSRPAPQTHWLAWQTMPTPHAFPQAPQFCESLATFAHCVPHIFCPAAHVGF